MHDPLIDALVRLLHELSSVVGGLTEAQYVAAPVGAFASSVGGHVRHCLDHVSALFRGLRGEPLDYDRRERGTPVETDRSAALLRIDQLLDEAQRLKDLCLTEPIALPVLLQPDQPAARVRSTFGRELAYVVSHTIHHNAILAAMVKTLGASAPHEFGLAPSTLAHQQSASCARSA